VIGWTCRALLFQCSQEKGATAVTAGRSGAMLGTARTPYDA